MSVQLTERQALGLKRLKQGGKATLIIVAVVGGLLLCCLCASAVATILLWPNIVEFLGLFFVPV